MDKEKLFKYCFGIEPARMPANVILTPFIPLKKIKRYCNETVNFSGMMYSGYISKCGEDEFSVVYSGIGDRLGGDAVLLMGGAGVKNLLFIGACGGLKGTKIGDIMICEKAFDGEGFSRYYRGSFRIAETVREKGIEGTDPVYIDRVFGFFNDRMNGHNVRKGKIFTIGSLLAETEENISFLEEKGIHGVEMEMSAVYRAANVSGIKSAGVLIVSDLPGESPLWENRAEREKNVFPGCFDEMIRLAVDFIKINSDQG